MRAPILAVVLTVTLGLGLQARAQMPKSEIDFIATIQDTRTVYEAQETKAKKTALVKEMVKRWKAILPDGMIHDWTGTIVELGKNKGGRFYLAVKIADRLHVMTWRTAFTDLGHGTLIGQKSPLYAVLSGLKLGDTIRFDGKYQNFVNLNERAKVYNTDLIVAFTSIAPAS
jgi:hypothetical protein